MRTNESTSADGGSADSRAETLDERAWRARPVVAVLIRLTTVLVPAVASFVGVWAAQRLVPRPGGVPAMCGWLVLMLAVGVAAMRSATFVTRRVAPLGTLFQMSLVFPDQAPSRFATALRARTGRHLQRALGDDPSTDQETAENLVTLLARLGAHDRMTRGHSERVRAYSVMLGEEIGLPEESLEKLNWAALAHDLGKLDVPATILGKRGRPNDEEWAILRGHPAAADKFVASLRPWLGEWVDCATQHHERIDGTGYPDGRRGNEISLSGRIVSIADAFDVMTAARSYKKPLPAEQARAELLRNAGTQFDADLVRSFLQISLPRRRWSTGVLGWAFHLPTLLRVPAVPVVQNLGNAAAAATISAAALVAVPQPVISAERIEAAERSVGPAGSSPPLTVPDDTTTTTSIPPTTVPSTTVPSTSIPPTTAPSTSNPPTTVPRTSPVPTTTVPTATVPTTVPTTTVAPGGLISSTTIPVVPTTVPGLTTTTTTSPPTTTAPSSTTTAVDDARTVLGLLPVTIAVLTNDDFGGSSADEATLTVVTEPTKGTASLVDGRVRYSPNLLAGGTDTFTYEICSVAESCDQATVTITFVL